MVAFFKVVQKQTIGKVANCIRCLWADNFLPATVKEVLKSEGSYESYELVKLCHVNCFFLACCFKWYIVLNFLGTKTEHGNSQFITYM